MPAPEPQQPEPIDEAAEEAAAAAEAANIGGAVSDYAGPTDLPATEAERPLAEAGEGEAEGQEQAELDLRTAAEPTAPGQSDAERQIDETIEQAANPLAGEQVEDVRPAEDPRGDAEAVPPAEAPPAEPPTEQSTWSPPVPERTDEPAPFDEEPSGEPVEYEPPTQEQPAVEPPKEETEEKKDEEGGSDWRTWSGRSINPLGKLPELAAGHAPRPHAPLEREPPQLGRCARAGQVADGGDLGRRHRPEAPQRLLDARMAVAGRLGAGGERGLAQPLVRSVALDRGPVAEHHGRRGRAAAALEVGREALDDRVRAEVHAQALEVEPAGLAGPRRAGRARCPCGGARAGSPRAAGG